MITDLQAMMEERLVAFRDRNQKNLPTRVLVYRDGVSEVLSAFSKIRIIELTVILRDNSSR